MSNDNPHISPTDGIEDVELEDDELEEKSFEELVKERRANDAEAVQQYREATGVSDETAGSSEVEKSDSDSTGGPVETVEVGPAENDGELIKRTGIARLGVDTTDPDEEAMRDLIKEAREDGETEIGFDKEDEDVDPVLSSIQSGTHEVREEFEKEVPLPEMEPTQQAQALAKEAAEDVNLDAIVKEAAELPKSPSAVRDQVYEKVYSDITKFVRTLYGESAVNTEVLKTVREKIATDAANRACVQRKANEDGVTVDSPNYNVSEGGEETVDTDGEEADGGETDAPETEGDSEDVDLSGDVDLEG